MSSIRTRVLTVVLSGAVAAGGATLLAGSAQAVTPQCANSSLSITNVPAEGATGHGSAVLLFKNVTHTTCTLYGYPGLDTLNSSFHPIAHATRTLHGFAGGPGVLKTITLGYGQYAAAVVEWLNFNPSTSGSCTFGVAVSTTAPNTTHSVKRPIHTSVCSLQIHPVQAGTLGNGDYAAAQTEWIAGSKAISAQQSSFWSKAVTYLNAAGTGEFATPVSQLKTLISLPETGLTPAQIALAHKEVVALDAFFQTPDLYY